MRSISLFPFLFFILSVNGQEDFLAKQYFNDGEYKKAIVFYENLVTDNPRRTDYVENLIACYQQLERYHSADSLLQRMVGMGNPFPPFFVELGYNQTLQGKVENARLYYNRALHKIEETPNFGYSVGLRFQKYVLLDEALQAFSRAMELNPQLDYNFYMARIYGEQGNVEKMYQSYLTLVQKGKTSKSNILRNIDDFITDDPENNNNQLLKKVLLQNAQKNPDVLWNEFLSWLFVKQNQFESALRQEKAIYKRTDNGVHRLEDLGEICLEAQHYETAIELFEFIRENTPDPISRLNAQLNLIDIDLITKGEKSHEKAQKRYGELMAAYGYAPQSLQLQVAYANFLAFQLGNAQEAIDILDKSLEMPLNAHGEAAIKLALGDILVFDQRFNQALIHFTQVQKRLKNDVLGQNARYKVAQTSFYKGDFDWAFTQLKVLRGSTSQLIANDAMQLSLLISDNSLEDSTQTALKKYARADLMAYQGKVPEALDILNDILENHKGEKIEDEALLRQGELLEAQGNLDAARFNFLKITEFYGDGILADDAHFALGELYRNKLNQPKKAQEHYEKIIYNYQDSYYYPHARRYFRRLRGDKVGEL